VIYYALVKININKGKIKKTVDGVILNDEENKIILVKRRFPPYQGHYALPGGFIQKGEHPENALKREIKEETNLDITIVDKIGYYDDPNRDPRGKVASTAFLCKIIDKNYELKAKTDSLSAEFIPIEDLKNISLAFDHKEIIKDSDILERKSFFD
jgi:8-oxo-dGTP diphosphatase